MASNSAPRRGRASVAFGSEAEVLPAGSADNRHSIPSAPTPTQRACRRRVLAARIDQPETHGDVVMVGGVLFVWFALHDVLGRGGVKAASAMTSQNARKRRDLAWTGADGFVEDESTDRYTGHPWREHRQAGA